VAIFVFLFPLIRIFGVLLRIRILTPLIPPNWTLLLGRLSNDPPQIHRIVKLAPPLTLQLPYHHFLKLQPIIDRVPSVAVLVFAVVHVVSLEFRLVMVLRLDDIVDYYRRLFCGGVVVGCWRSVWVWVGIRVLVVWVGWGLGHGGAVVVVGGGLLVWVVGVRVPVVLGRWWRVEVLSTLLAAALLGELLDDFHELIQELLTHFNGSPHNTILHILLDRRCILGEANFLMMHRHNLPTLNHLHPPIHIPFLFPLFLFHYPSPLIPVLLAPHLDHLLQPPHPLPKTTPIRLQIALGFAAVLEHGLVFVHFEGFVRAVDLVSARELVDVLAEVVLGGVGGGELAGVGEMVTVAFG
jgi:hypothetical protein